MAKPVSLIGHNHVCPMVDPGPKPHVGGPIVNPGQVFVRVNGQPMATVGGTCTCVGPPDTLTQGSGIVKIMGKPVVRLGDSTAHGGKVVMGVPTVRMD
jgi:uncharacterized Zn-binding protein involved in type VI secretion